MDRAVVVRLDERSRAGQNEEGTLVMVHQQPSNPRAETDVLGAAPRPDIRALSTSLTPEQKEAEKVRLQELVSVFVRSAAKGCQCTYIKEDTGERCITCYFLDKCLEHLIVVAAGDATVAEVRCPVNAIQDIYCFVEDGVSCFPTKMVRSLSAEEQSLLMMVVYRSERGGNHRFCLLADSCTERDNFLECLRVLCVYIQSIANGHESALPPRVTQSKDLRTTLSAA